MAQRLALARSPREDGTGTMARGKHFGIFTPCIMYFGKKRHIGTVESSHEMGVVRESGFELATPNTGLCEPEGVR